MTEQEILIETQSTTHSAFLNIPENAKGLVIFVHGSGSSRFSPRNNFVARALNASGLATLLFDLLTEEEDKIDQYTREFRFDISLLAKRLILVTDWVANNPDIKDYALAYFGSSTGAAAALIAAAERPDLVKAVVSRGGRPDLADGYLVKVKAPSLFVVGGLDFEVIELNREAMAQMQCATKLEIVNGATHLFEESGKLEEVTNIVKNYLLTELV